MRIYIFSNLDAKEIPLDIRRKAQVIFSVEDEETPDSTVVRSNLSAEQILYIFSEMQKSLFREVTSLL